MFVRKHSIVCGMLVMGITVPVIGAPNEDTALVAKSGTEVLWSDPGDVTTRDLFYGPGGAGHQPHEPYTFLKEDMDGTNPKFVVRDADGVKWKVKLGVEARPETAATRLVWAVGYAVNEDYFLADLRVANMPARLHRGQKLISPDGSMHNVRLKREDEKKTGEWQWRHDPFEGTREWNGLRVMMAMLNNWDLKDSNNATYKIDSQTIYLVSDLGSSFGTTGLSWPHSKAKGNLNSYSHSKFIRRTTDTTIDFSVPSRPQLLYLVHPLDFFHHLHERWIGTNIPRADVHWIGELLARLSSQQIQEAFRAAGYSPDEVRAFAEIVARRITQLTEL